ncbi:phage baseplate assembly protein V [Aquitalea sp. USM4]|uniref:phage baseplate assembly protein V n=1 Tax=Aquitalea sp. USM4 TaxID=1590041 RepID=UPI00103AF2F9|nr:phage baseplate assembly protein V [Aquitalea sp. USM4]QBJ80506.1 phage baseplate assembly protein V [Aquitalea sp. USM4]
MRELINAMRMHHGDGRTYARKGTISSYDPNSHAVKVTLQPDGQDTGWIQLGAMGVGNGICLAMGPSIGDEVEVSFDSGDPNLGSVTARFFNDTAPPPGVPSGEIWMVAKGGATIKLHADGSIEITSPTTITHTAAQHHFVGPVQMDNTLQVTQQISGNGGMAIQSSTGVAMTVTGSMTATGTVTGQTDVVGGGKSLKTHTHTAQGANAVTTAPN